MNIEQIKARWFGAGGPLETALGWAFLAIVAVPVLLAAVCTAYLWGPPLAGIVLANAATNKDFWEKWELKL